VRRFRFRSKFGRHYACLRYHSFKTFWQAVGSGPGFRSARLPGRDHLALASEVGIEVLCSARDCAAIKRFLAEVGYNGEKIVVNVPTDVSELGDLTRTGAKQRRRAGMNVDLQDFAKRQDRICVDLPKQLWEEVLFIPIGEYWQASAYGKRLTDILPGRFTTFYGVLWRVAGVGQITRRGAARRRTAPALHLLTFLVPARPI
jgi:hypothetical protein